MKFFLNFLFVTYSKKVPDLNYKIWNYFAYLQFFFLFAFHWFFFHEKMYIFVFAFLQF